MLTTTTTMKTTETSLGKPIDFRGSIAKFHYERTRGLSAFSMPYTGDEGVKRRMFNQHGVVYLFDDDSRFYISERHGRVKYADPNEHYVAVRSQWERRRNGT